MILNDKEYKLSYRGSTLLIYKEEFGTDMIADCKKMFTDKDYDMVTFLQVFWAMARTNDKTMPKFREFMDEVSANELVNNADLVQEMIQTINDDGTPNKVKKK